jgi:hypothetical protein
LGQKTFTSQQIKKEKEKQEPIIIGIVEVTYEKKT